MNTDLRHFPLTLAAVNTLRVIAAAFIHGVSHDHMVYNDAYYGHALDVLSRELREDGDYETDGARRYGALLFALETAPRLHADPAELGFSMPMR